MEIPLNATFPNMDGSDMVHDDGKGNLGPSITVKDAIVMAAVQELPGDGTSSNVMQEKLMRFRIYQKLVKAEQEVVHFTSEECAHLKDRVVKIFGVLIAGPVALLLDGHKDHGLKVPASAPQQEPVPVETGTK